MNTFIEEKNLSKIFFQKNNPNIWSTAFLCTSNEEKETNLKTQYQYNCSRKNEYLGVNLTKHIKKIIWRTLQMLMKEVKEHHNKWRDLRHSWFRRLKIIKMPVLPQLMYSFNVVPIKFQANCL